MKISEFNIYRYNLPLKKPYKVKDVSVDSREGFIIQLISDNGYEGLGEAAPLVEFSEETLTQVEEQIKNLRDLFIGKEIDENISKFNGELAEFCGSKDLYASASFAIESAVINLYSKEKNIPLNKILKESSDTVVKVTGLLRGKVDEVCEQLEVMLTQGYKDFKLKVGQDVNEDICKVNKLAELINGKALLHVDANRRWSYQDAVDFAKEIDFRILTYIEEPFEDIKRIPEYFNETLIPLALDESFQGQQLKEIGHIEGLEILVLKPSVIGGVEKLWHQIHIIQDLGIKPVLSSSFESPIGIMTIAHLVSCLKGVSFAGIDTLKWFKEGLFDFDPIKNGAIDLSVGSIKLSQFNEEVLQRIS